MREAKVDETVFSFEVCVCERSVVVVCERERSTDEWFADAFVRFGDSCAGHTSFFVAEVDGQAGASEKEEDACLP